jgi:hypothetical protein
VEVKKILPSAWVEVKFHFHFWNADMVTACHNCGRIFQVLFPTLDQQRFLCEKCDAGPHASVVTRHKRKRPAAKPKPKVIDEEREETMNDTPGNENHL